MKASDSNVSDKRNQQAGGSRPSSADSRDQLLHGFGAWQDQSAQPMDWCSASRRTGAHRPGPVGPQRADEPREEHCRSWSLWRLSRVVSVAKRAIQRWQASGLVEMAHKSYYVAIFCLSLLIVACLLASFVITRRVTDPDLEADTSGAGAQGLARARPATLEFRSVDLVDLTECDKTFAYTRSRLRVLVPSSSGAYVQRPYFLRAQAAPQQYRQDAHQQEPGRQDGPEPTRFVLADAHRLAAGAQEPSQAESSQEMAHHQPASGGAVASQADGVTGPPAGQPAAPTVDLDQDARDPLRVVAADMGLSLDEINSTLVDCFIVDTDKRYGQKVAIEDRHRQVASTRRVPFGKMLDTIRACRLLTWATLAGAGRASRGRLEGAQLAGNKSEPAGGWLQEVVRPVERAADEQTPAANMFSSLLGPWLAANLAPEPAAGGLEPGASESAPGGAVASSRGQAQQGARAAELDPSRASYLGMGVSMVNGIVPNTLWCGLGDRAANYSELGAEYKVDACCRAHDHCPIRLKPFAADYGLINWSMSTRSHCGCDLDFGECLTSVNSTLAGVIKTLYFRFVGLQCIDLAGRAQLAPGSAPELAPNLNP